MLRTSDLQRAILCKEGERFDVIVCGGGPAGIGAAIAAKEAGASVLLLEGSSLMGGVAAAAMWMPVNRITLDGVTPEGGKRGGVHDRFVAAIQRHGGEAYSMRRHPATDRRGGMQIHPEYLRLAVMELLEDCGCKYRLFSPVTGVIKQENCVTGVVATTKEGTETFYAERVIDCTGDGDVAYYAGVEMQKGRESDGIFLPPALLFTLSNVDIDAFYRFKLSQTKAYQDMIDKAAGQGALVCRWYDFDETSLPGVVNVNNGGLEGWEKLDMTNPDDRTVAERMGIQAAIDFTNFVRSMKMPGLEDCHLMRAGYQVAIRDTRRIVGEYLISHEDALEAPEFKDIVSRRYGFIDAVGYYTADMVSGHAYPYRCLVPAHIDGLLVAGRCASATHLGFASGRGMGECMGMGQAAGVAAALSIQQQVQPRHVSVSSVQGFIRGMGVKL